MRSASIGLVKEPPAVYRVSATGRKYASMVRQIVKLHESGYNTWMVSVADVAFVSIVLYISMPVY